MPSEIEAWINEAAATLGIDVTRLAQSEAIVISREIEAKFVNGSPSWWWLGLKTPYVSYDSTSMRLSNILPRLVGRVFFLPDTDDGNPLPVFSLEAQAVEALIKECPHFEYYVVDCDRAWLVAETHHNMFIVCSTGPIHLKPGGKVWPEE